MAKTSEVRVPKRERMRQNRAEANRVARQESYPEVSRLDPTPQQSEYLAEECAASLMAWNWLMANLVKGESQYFHEKRFFAEYPARSSLRHHVQHCALRDAHCQAWYGAKAVSPVHGELTFRVGGSGAYFDKRSVVFGDQLIRLTAEWAPEMFDGAPYIGSMRVRWTIEDGWTAEFLLREDEADERKLKAIKRGG